VVVILDRRRDVEKVAPELCKILGDLYSTSTRVGKKLRCRRLALEGYFVIETTRVS
jgi:hypothetical protein